MIWVLIIAATFVALSFLPPIVSGGGHYETFTDNHFPGGRDTEE